MVTGAVSLALVPPCQRVGDTELGLLRSTWSARHPTPHFTKPSFSSLCSSLCPQVSPTSSPPPVPSTSPLAHAMPPPEESTERPASGRSDFWGERLVTRMTHLSGHQEGHQATRLRAQTCRQTEVRLGALSPAAAPGGDTNFRKPPL